MSSENNTHQRKIKIWIDSASEPLTFSQSPILVGRSPECQLVLNDKSVSRSHLRIEWNQDDIKVTDLGSSFGTTIKSLRIESFKPYSISEGQKLLLGQCWIDIKFIAQEINNEIKVVDVPSLSEIIKVEHKSAIPQFNKNNEFEEQNKIFADSAARAHQEYLAITQKLKTAQDELAHYENALLYKKDEKTALETLVTQLNKEKDQAIQIKSTLSIEVKSLQEALAILNPEVQELRSIKTITEPEVKKAQEQLKELNKEIDEKEIFHEKILSEFEKNKHSIQSTIETLSKEKELISIKLKITEDRIKTLTHEIELLEKTFQENNENKNRLLTEIEKFKKESKKQEEEYLDLKSKKETIYDLFLKEKRNFDQLTQEQLKLNDSHERLIENHTHLKNEFTEKSELLKSLKDQLSDTSENLAKSEKEKVILDQELQVYKAEAQSLELKVKNLKDTHTHLEKTKQELDICQRELAILEKEKAISETTLNTLTHKKEATEKHLEELKQTSQTLIESIKNKEMAQNSLILKIETTKDECKQLEKSRNSLALLLKNEKTAFREYITSAQGEMKKLRDKTARHIFNAKKRFKVRSDELVKQKKIEAAQLIEKTQLKANEIILKTKNKSETQYNETMAALQKEVDTKRASLDQELSEKTKKTLEAFNLELKNKRTSAEEELQKYQFSQREAFEQNINKDKLDFSKMKKERVSVLSTCIEELILSEISLLKELKKNDIIKLQPFHEHLKNEIKNIIEITFESTAPNAEILKKQINFNPHSLLNQKKFWRKVSLYAVGFAVALTCLSFVVIEWDKISKIAREQIHQKNESAERTLQILREENIDKYVFNPELTEEFKENYTDNVIYNKHYMNFKTDQEVNKDWISKLNKFFIHEIDLNDRIIVSFIPTEAKLIMELKELRKALMPQSLEKGIQAMRDAEQKYIDEMSILIEGRTNFHKFKLFEKKYFEEWLKTNSILRVPASSQEKK